MFIVNLFQFLVTHTTMPMQVRRTIADENFTAGWWLRTSAIFTLAPQLPQQQRQQQTQTVTGMTSPAARTPSPTPTSTGSSCCTTWFNQGKDLFTSKLKISSLKGDYSWVIYIYILSSTVILPLMIMYEIWNDTSCMRRHGTGVSYLVG